MTQVRTIGYEGASIHDFVATIEYLGIDAVVDIRELPISRRKGFAKTALSQALSEAGVEYIHLKGLGDPKPGRDAARAGRTSEFIEIFTAHMDTENAQEDFATLKGLAAEKSVCLLCYERDHRHCHRAIVAAELEKEIDAEIVHIGVQDPDTIRRHSHSRT